MATNKQGREGSVKRALANSALEGLKPDPQFTALLDQYINGEISLEKALEYTKARFYQEPDSKL